MAKRRAPRNTAERYGEIGAHAEWDAVVEHYDWDRVEEAYETALRLGASYGARTLRLYRLVEGEALTRRSGAIENLDSWLSLETIEAELDGVEALGTRIRSACEIVAARLGWDCSEKTLVSVLAIEADAPWNASRYGYCVDKYPFDKVCIPNAVCRREDELRKVVMHEFAHVAVLNRTQGRAPQWLEEAISILMEGEALEAVAHPFRIGRAAWLDPRDLELAFGAERRDSSQIPRIWHAYQQSAVLGHWLHSHGGDAGLSRFLGAFPADGFWQEAKSRWFGIDPSDVALRRAYGTDVAGLFREARDWIR